MTDLVKTRPTTPLRWKERLPNRLDVSHAAAACELMLRFDGGADGIVMVVWNHFEPAVASVPGVAPQVPRRCICSGILLVGRYPLTKLDYCPTLPVRSYRFDALLRGAGLSSLHICLRLSLFVQC